MLAFYSNFFAIARLLLSVHATHEVMIKDYHLQALQLSLNAPLMISVNLPLSFTESVLHPHHILTYLQWLPYAHFFICVSDCDGMYCTINISY